jgi:hypothetical protein
MKKLLSCIAIFNFFWLTSCEEVVELDLNTASPRLVIDAAIDWEKGTPGNEQIIRIHKTTGFYSSTIPAVSDALVTVENSAGIVFSFNETAPGIYVCLDFIPIINESYLLKVVVEGETYTANEIMRAVPSINRIEQTNEAGFSGSDIEIKFFFDDIPNQTNFYLGKYITPLKSFPEFDAIEDRFFENNELFGYYSNPDLESEMNINFSLLGISQNYFSYMRILLGQTSENNGSPFQTPPATVRGNIVNQTNFNNFALGFFRVSEKVTLDYIVQ